MVKLSFIIVNYNTRDILKMCLDNLLGIWGNMEIIVVDNASSDGSSDMIEKEYSKTKEVILIKTKNNGIAAGCNLGVAKASGDYYIYIGTDAFPSRNSIKEIVEYMEDEKNKDVGIVTPKLVTRDGKIDWDAHRGLATPWSSLAHFFFLDRIFSKSKIFNKYFLGYKDFTKPHEIDVCIVHFMVMRKEVMDKVKKWDENFFVYGEDLDICYRTQKAGFKIMYLPNISVLHYKGVSVGRKETKDIKTVSNTSKETKRRMLTASVDAMKMFYKKHLEKKYPWILNKIVYFGIFCMRSVRLLFKSKIF